jgi:hypothetical protein
MSKKILFKVREMYLKQYSSISLRNRGGNDIFRVVDNFAIKANLTSIKIKIAPLNLP